jgi:uncharacterized protein (TIGR02271 family)
MSNTNSNDTNDYHHEEVVKEEEARGLGDGSDFGEIQSDDSNLKYNKGSLSENKKEKTETSTDNFFSQTKKEEEEIIIPLISEELGVTKTELVDEAIITKEPFKETKTEELAIMHEELVIERRPVIDNLSSVDHNDNNYKTLSGYENEKVNLEKTNTIIKIPLKREEIEVTKKPYIIEELLVKKKPVTKTQTLTEEIITERVIDPQV